MDTNDDTLLSAHCAGTLDGSRTRSFYLAHAGLEKLTADLGDLFRANVAPTGAQIAALGNAPPALGVNWLQPDGTDGYDIAFPVDGAGNPSHARTTSRSSRRRARRSRFRPSSR